MTEAAKDPRELTIRELYDLSGQVAVVTGAAKGIGLAIANRFAEAGATLLLADIDGETVRAVRDAVRQRGGTASECVSDLSTVAGAVEPVRAAKAAYGRVDLLVNNAGIYPMVPSLELSEQVWDRTLDLNLKGLFFAAQAAAREMADSGRGGAIINIASVDAFKPTGNLVHYDASKGGVVMLTKSLAKELGPRGVRVNAIAPGGIQTPGTEQTELPLPPGVDAEAMLRQMLAALPLGRMGQPDDVARLALFLASPASAYMTGSTVVVDGGMLIA